MTVRNTARQVLGLAEPSASNVFVGLSGVVGFLWTLDNENDFQSDEELALNYGTAILVAVYGLGNATIGLADLIRSGQRPKLVLSRLTGVGQPPSLSNLVLLAALGSKFMESWQKTTPTIESADERLEELLVCGLVSGVACIPLLKSLSRGLRALV